MSSVGRLAFPELAFGTLLLSNQRIWGKAFFFPPAGPVLVNKIHVYKPAVPMWILIASCLGELSEGKKVACEAQDLQRSLSKQTCLDTPADAGMLNGGGGGGGLSLKCWQQFFGS